MPNAKCQAPSAKCQVPNAKCHSAIAASHPECMFHGCGNPRNPSWLPSRGHKMQYFRPHIGHIYWPFDFQIFIQNFKILVALGFHFPMLISMVSWASTTKYLDYHGLGYCIGIDIGIGIGIPVGLGCWPRIDHGIPFRSSSREPPLFFSSCLFSVHRCFVSIEFWPYLVATHGSFFPFPSVLVFCNPTRPVWSVRCGSGRCSSGLLPFSWERRPPCHTPTSVAPAQSVEPIQAATSCLILACRMGILQCRNKCTPSSFPPQMVRVPVPMLVAL